MCEVREFGGDLLSFHHISLCRSADCGWCVGNGCVEGNEQGPSSMESCGSGVYYFEECLYPGNGGGKEKE